MGASGLVAGVVNSVLNSITSSSNALALFQELNNSIPLDEFKNAFEQLNEHPDSFTVENAELYSETHFHLLYAVDDFFLSSQSIYEWCRSAIGHLERYLLFRQEYSQAKARTLPEILDPQLD